MSNDRKNIEVVFAETHVRTIVLKKWDYRSGVTISSHDIDKRGHIKENEDDPIINIDFDSIPAVIEFLEQQR